jgi:hypothetical protein
MSTVFSLVPEFPEQGQVLLDSGQGGGQVNQGSAEYCL